MFKNVMIGALVVSMILGGWYVYSRFFVAGTTENELKHLKTEKVNKLKGNKEELEKTLKAKEDFRLRRNKIQSNYERDVKTAAEEYVRLKDQESDKLADGECENDLESEDGNGDSARNHYGKRCITRRTPALREYAARELKTKAGNAIYRDMLLKAEKEKSRALEEAGRSYAACFKNTIRDNKGAESIKVRNKIETGKIKRLQDNEKEFKKKLDKAKKDFEEENRKIQASYKNSMKIAEYEYSQLKAENKKSYKTYQKGWSGDNHMKTSTTPVGKLYKREIAKVKKIESIYNEKVEKAEKRKTKASEKAENDYTSSVEIAIRNKNRQDKKVWEEYVKKIVKINLEIAKRYKGKQDKKVFEWYKTEKRKIHDKKDKNKAE